MFFSRYFPHSEKQTDLLVSQEFFLFKFRDEHDEKTERKQENGLLKFFPFFCVSDSDFSSIGKLLCWCVVVWKSGENSNAYIHPFGYSSNVCLPIFPISHHSRQTYFAQRFLHDVMFAGKTLHASSVCSRIGRFFSEFSSSHMTSVWWFHCAAKWDLFLSTYFHIFPFAILISILLLLLSRLGGNVGKCVCLGVVLNARRPSNNKIAD